MSKKAIIIPIIAIFILLSIISIFFFIPGQQIITSPSYTCPDNKICQITPTLNCDILSDEGKVIARTNANSFSINDLIKSNVWIALDGNNDGAMEGYLKSTASTNCLSRSIIYPIPNNNDIYFRSNAVYVCDGDKAYEYIATTTAETSNFPIEPYSLNNQEIYSGKLYKCEKDILINNELKDTLIYSGANTGKKTGKTYAISGGTITSEGLGIIEWSVLINDVPITTCTTSDGSILQIGESRCISEYELQTCELVGNNAVLTSQTALPPQICKNDQIKDAYLVETILSKTVISKSDPLIIDFNLKNTEDNRNIPITVKICKNNDCSVASKTQNTGNTYPNIGKTQFTFNNLPIGYYTVRISFNHPDGDYIKEYDLQVTEELSLIVTANSQIQYDAKPIEVLLKSFKSQLPKQLSNYEIDLVYNGKKINDYIVEPVSLGVLKFSISNLNGDGILRVRARGNDETGLWTDYTDYFEINVKKATILYTTDFKTDVCTGIVVQKFQTKDSIGNLVDTQNTITIDKPLGGKDQLNPSGSNGNYEFSYNFDVGGTYIIRIASNNPSLGTSQLNSGQGQLINILTGSSCQNGGCEGVSCYVGYIIITTIILAVGLFIYFVFFFRRRK